MYIKLTHETKNDIKMKTKKIALSLTITLLSISCLADGYQGREDIKPDGRKTIVRQHERHGALLPFKTWNDWDGKDRPCCWNGYGPDPYGPNFWYYYSPETECYPGYDSVWEGTDACKKELTNPPDDVKTIPEPGLPLMLGIGCIMLWRHKR